MNVELLRKLQDREIILLAKSQLKFLDEVISVIEENFLKDSPLPLPKDDVEIPEMTYKMSTMLENLDIIIDGLKKGRKSRNCFMHTFPEWKIIRVNGIKKLKEIAQSIKKDRFNSNVSKLVGYCTSAVGGGVTLASAILIPFTLGLSTPLMVAGGAITAAGCSTAIGTSVTEVILLKTKIEKAQEIIKEDSEHFKKMSDWLDHADKLEKAISEILSIGNVTDINERIDKFIQQGMDIKKDFKRLNHIRVFLRDIQKSFPKKLQVYVPDLSDFIFVSVLVAFHLLRLNPENRIIFDCASLTVKSLVGIASVAHETVDAARLVNLFSGSAVATKNVAKAVTRGAVAVVGIALDVVSITLTSIDLHKGSLSSQAEKIEKVAKEMEEEAKTLQEVYENLRKTCKFGKRKEKGIAPTPQIVFNFSYF